MIEYYWIKYMSRDSVSKKFFGIGRGSKIQRVKITERP